MTQRVLLFFPQSLAQHHLPRPILSSPGHWARWTSWLTMMMPVPPGWYVSSLDSCWLWLRLQWHASHQYLVCSAGYKCGGALFHATLHSMSAQMSTCAAFMNDHSAASFSDPLSAMSMPPIFCSTNLILCGSFGPSWLPHVMVVSVWWACWLFVLLIISVPRFCCFACCVSLCLFFVFCGVFLFFLFLLVAFIVMIVL